MTATITLATPEEVYLQRLRVLGAWWRLGSSALSSELLLAAIEYAASRDASTPPDLPDVAQ